ncbi:hypothetical protein HGRIS_008964 [Hohenbuehelia grisea]|uniref:F-box domain-containing protein n=1 Tax=Hohenbuehelia grisea TaxID=104357 RepID=A0ABR3IZS8_9AGAR
MSNDAYSPKDPEQHPATGLNVLPDLQNMPCSSHQLTDALLWRLAQDSSEDGIEVRELDDLEHKLSMALSIIRSRKNMSSPVHRLPPEVLATIFDKLRDLSTPLNFLPEISDTGPYPMDAVSRVCRRWRRTALGIPPLWNLIFRAEPSVMSSSLARSRGTPLKVYLQGDSHWPGPASDESLRHDADMLLTVKSHMHRIQELHLIDNVATATVLELLQQPAPVLESLTLSLYTSFTIPTQPLPALPVLLAGVTPNLRRLTMNGFTSWSANLFPNLTHLALSNQDVGTPIPLSQFISYLSACPNLQELDIVRPAFGFGTSVTQTVSLEQLRTLSLGSWNSSNQISEFLACLTLPAKLKLFIWGCRFNPEDTLSDVCPFSPALLADITEFRVTHNPDRQLGSLDLGWGHEDNLYNIILTPTSFQVDGAFPPSQVLLLAPNFFPLGMVTELWIGHQAHPEPENEAWRTFFASLPLLRTLVISRRSSQPIISALTREGDVGHPWTASVANASTGPPSDVLCPELRTLRLYADASRSVLRLAILAEERMRLGCPIETLQVISSASRQSSRRSRSPELISDLMYLQKYIKNVDCERRESSLHWELLSDWPPRIFNWVPGERR